MDVDEWWFARESDFSRTVRAGDELLRPLRLRSELFDGGNRCCVDWSGVCRCTSFIPIRHPRQGEQVGVAK